MSVVAQSIPDLVAPDHDPARQPDFTDFGFRRNLRARPDLADRAAAREGGGLRPNQAPVEEHQFMWLLVRNLPELRGYARRLTGKQAEANDLVQETCRRAIESRSRFTSGSDMRAWLCCILRNYHRDRLRRLSREMLVGDHDGQFATPSPEPCASWALVSDDDLEQALASLQPQYRSAYVLHAMDGRSYGEVAQALGVPSSTVGTRILRARQLLRVFLLDLLEQRGLPIRSPLPPSFPSSGERLRVRGSR